MNCYADNGLDGKIKIKKHSKESHIGDTIALLVMIGISLIKDCNSSNLESCLVAISIFIIVLIYKYLHIEI